MARFGRKRGAGQRRRVLRGKPRRRGGARKRSSMPAMPSAGRGQNATIVETVTFQDQIANQGYSNTFDLSQFPRASALAPNFQYYKAARVIYEYTPLYNTFQDATGSAAASKPYLYSVMNRTQSLINYGVLQQLQEMGARPTQLIGIRKISYKPNWCSPGLIAQDGNNPTNGIQQLGGQKQYTWLACPSLYPGGGTGGPIPAVLEGSVSASSVIPAPYTIPTANNKVTYNGHATFIEQKNGDTLAIAQLTVTVHWMFKGANFRDNKGST